MKTTAPRGTFDLLPEEVLVWSWVEESIKCVFHTYGYGEIRTPIFEHTELFQRGIGETTDIVEKEMYTMTDKGGRSITLRPEGTAPVVRSFIEHKLFARAGVTRLFYLGPMFRQERPQAGRFRQFHQFGLELLGEEGPMADAEVITLAVDLYKELGLTDLEVHLNSLGCAECRGRYRTALLSYFSQTKATLCESCQDRLERNPLRVLDCKNPKCRELMKEIPSIQNYICSDCAQHFTQLCNYLDEVKVNYEIDSRLVRGFDYYTKTVFEIINQDLGAQSAVCGGGRYDRLVQECGGPPTPGVGFASGFERLLTTLEQKGKLPNRSLAPQVYLVVLDKKYATAGYGLGTTLRRQGIETAVSLKVKSLKAQMKTADKLGASFTLIIGEEEWENHQVTLRDMRGSKQIRVEWERVPEILRKELAEKAPDPK